MHSPKVFLLGFCLFVFGISSVQAEWRTREFTGHSGAKGVIAHSMADGAVIGINCTAETDTNIFELALKPDGLPYLDESSEHHANLSLRFDYADGRRTPQAHAMVWYDAEIDLWSGALTMNAVEFEHFGGAATLSILAGIDKVVATLPLDGSRKAQRRMRDVCHDGADLAAGILPDYFDDASSPDEHAWQVVQKPDAADPGVAARITDGQGTLTLQCVKETGITIWFQHPGLSPVSPVELYVHALLPTGERYSAYGTPDTGPEKSYKGSLDFRPSAIRGLGLGNRVQVELGNGATFLDARNGNSVTLYQAIANVCGFRGYEPTPDEPECGVPDPVLSEAGCTALISVMKSPERLALAYDLRAEARMAGGDRVGAVEDLQTAAELVSPGSEARPVGGKPAQDAIPSPDAATMLQRAREAAAAGNTTQARALAERVQQAAPAGAAIGREAGYFLHRLDRQEPE